MIKMTFAEKLQKCRKENGMSQEQLAQTLAVSRQAVSKWETGESLPDAGKLVQLSRLFDVPVDALLKDELPLEKTEPVQPAAQGTEAKPEMPKKHTALLVWGAVLSGLGTLGFAVIWVLSTMIEGFVDCVTQDEYGNTWYTMESGYSFSGFVEKYRLEAVLIICGVLLAVGLLLFFIRYFRRKGRSLWDVLGM